jgi:hypothetical protein
MSQGYWTLHKDIAKGLAAFERSFKKNVGGN